MTVAIFRGPSGAGKSTLIKALTDPITISPFEEIRELQAKFDNVAKVNVYSADFYFTDGKGEYHFNPRALGEAHGDCLRKYTNAIRDLENFQRPNVLLIVDNTNCTIAEVAPYASLATAFHHELHVFTLIARPEVCARRNTHGVSLEAIQRQCANLERSLQEWPPWWPSKILHAKG